MKKFALKAVAASALALGLSVGAHATLINGGFETSPAIGASNFILTPQATVPGWRTDAADGIIEIWKAPGPNSQTGTGVGSTPAYEGSQYAELNATEPSQLYQDATGIAKNAQIGWQLAHRGRIGTDVMQVIITDLGADGLPGGAGLNSDTELFRQTISDGASAWGFYGISSNVSSIIALGNTVRFAFEAVSSTSPTPGLNLSYGNLLDATDFGTTVVITRVPEPASLALVGVALLAAAGASRRKSA